MRQYPPPDEVEAAEQRIRRVHAWAALIVWIAAIGGALWLWLH